MGPPTALWLGCHGEAGDECARPLRSHPPPRHRTSLPRVKDRGAGPSHKSRSAGLLNVLRRPCQRLQSMRLRAGFSTWLRARDSVLVPGLFQSPQGTGLQAV